MSDGRRLPIQTPAGNRRRIQLAQYNGTFTLDSGCGWGLGLNIRAFRRTELKHCPFLGNSREVLSVPRSGGDHALLPHLHTFTLTGPALPSIVGCPCRTRAYVKLNCRVPYLPTLFRELESLPAGTKEKVASTAPLPLQGHDLPVPDITPTAPPTPDSSSPGTRCAPWTCELSKACQQPPPSFTTGWCIP